MAWNLSSFLRSAWLRAWKRPGPKTVFRSRLELERFEARNPPSSLLVGGPGGGGAGNASEATLRIAPVPAARNAGERFGVAGANVSSTANSVTTVNAGNGSAPSATNAPVMASFAEPFSDLFADPLADANPRKPHVVGAPGLAHSENNSSAGNTSQGSAAAPFTAAVVPLAANDQSASNDLWQSLNRLGTTSTPSPTVTAPAPASPPPATNSAAANLPPVLGAKYQNPLSFTVNRGQTDSSVQYLSQNPGYSAFFTASGATFAFAQPGQPGPGDALALHLDGANPNPQIVAEDPLQGRTNYFVGGSAATVQTGVQQYGKLVYEDVYPGVNLVFHASTDNQFEYDFQIQPGADLSQVRLTWQGAQGLTADNQGNLHIQTPAGDLVEQQPNLYQGSGSAKQAVRGGYDLLANNQVSFTAGAFDANQPLTVDPVIGFSNVLGSSGNDSGNALAVAPDGTSTVVGTTASSDFPTSLGAYQTSTTGGTDAFVSRYSPTGVLLWSSYLGGSGDDSGNGVALDAAGEVYVVGTSASSNFPTTAGAYQTSLQGGTDAFVSKLNVTGSALLYSTYDGTAHNDTGNAITVDRYQDAYFTGTRHNATTGLDDLAIVKLNNTGTAQSYAYVVTSGTGNTTGLGIALDSSDNAYVTGVTADGSFPVTGGVLQTTLAGTTNAFVLKLNTAGSSLSYATYLGGSASDSGQAIAVDSSGNAYVAGSSSSTNFPTSAGAYQTTNAGGTDAFISKLNSAATTLTYSTYLGGSSNDAARALVLDPDGYATVVGATASSNFPTANAIYGSLSSSQDAFAARLNTTGTALVFSTFLGGVTTDQANGVGLDDQDNIYLTGSLSSGADAFVTQILMPPGAPVITAISPDTGSSSTDQLTNNQNLNLSGTATKGATVTVSRSDLGVLGSVTADATTGDWTFTYSGTTLPEGEYAFTATQTVAGDTGVASAPFLVTVDLTAPAVYLTAPASTTSLGPVVVVTATDAVGLPASPTVTLDVDLNNDGSFSGSELDYASGTLVNGTVAITLPTLPGTGTYHVRAHVTDLAGNQGTSATDTFTVAGSSASLTAEVLSSNPLNGNSELELGNVQATQMLDIDNSPGTAASNNLQLVFNSDRLANAPFIQATVQTDNSVALPSTITTSLTWDGPVIGSNNYTYSTTGFSPGDALTLSQLAGASYTGLHNWTMQVTLNYASTTQNYSVSGTALLVDEEGSHFGPGWTLSDVNQLVTLTSDTIGAVVIPASMEEIYGTTGAGYFGAGASTGTFTSPAFDHGTLTFDGSHFYDVQPDGETITFNSGGYQTEWQSAGGQQSMQFRYNGSGNLTGITNIDGSLATFNYDVSDEFLTSISAANGLTTFSYDLYDNLSTITYSNGATAGFGYDVGAYSAFPPLLTGQTFGDLQNEWEYNTSALGSPLTTITNGVTVESVSPAVFQGNTNPSPATVQGTIRATETQWPQGVSTGSSGTPDLPSQTTTWEFDDAGRPLQEWAANGGRTQWTYDGAGDVTSMTDPDGNETTYSRDGAGYVLTQTNPDSTTEVSAYQSLNHSRTSSTDELSHTTTYAYDVYSNLTSETDPLNHTQAWTYTGGGQVASSTDADSHTTTYAYDSFQRLTSETDPLGDTTGYSYDSSGNLYTTTDALGKVTTTLNDTLGNTTETINPLGQASYATYEGAGLVTTSSDALGIQTNYYYNTSGQVVETVAAVGTAAQVTTYDNYDDADELTASVDALGITTTFGYDAVNAQTSVQDATGYLSRTIDDLAGQPVLSMDNLGNWVKESYNRRGWVTSSTDGVGQTTTTAYDADGQVTSVTDPMSHAQTTAYDAAGQVTVAADAAGKTVTTTYDNAGNVSTVTNANGFVTSYSYDSDNRQTKDTDAVGTSAQQTMTQAYDARGDVTSETDARGNHQTLEYDAAGQQTATLDAYSQSVTSSLDGDGRVTASTNELGQTTTYAYDQLSRQTSMTDSNHQVSTTVYDANGNVVETLDGLGDASYSAYDDLGRQITSTDADGHVTSYAYDVNGNRTAVTDPDNNTTHYVYDRDGRQTLAIDPTGATTTTTYDNAGNVSTVTDRDGRETLYSYDNNNREMGAVWKSSVGGTTVNTQTFTYDYDGNELTAADVNGTITFTYNPVGQVSSQTDVFGLTTTYAYNTDEQVTQVQDALGGTTTSAYDNNGRLTTQEFTDGTAVLREDFTYANNGDESTTTRYNGLAGTAGQVIGTTTYGYDGDDRVTAITSKNNSAATMAYYNYGYDSANRVTTLTTLSGGTETYSYDAAGQLLTDNTGGASAATFSYDDNGNRTMAGYQTGAENRVSNDGTYTYTYDAEGNLTEKSKGSVQETWYYTYNQKNMLTSVRETTDGSTNEYTATYTYDALNRRVTESDWQTGVGSSATRMAYDKDGTLWADLTTSNTLVMRYVTGDSAQQLIARVDGSGNVGWYLQDKMGTVRDVLNASGSVVDTIQYGAYGNVLNQTSPTDSGRLLYDGQAENVYIGIVAAKDRSLLVGVGRWMQEDPITFDGGLSNLSDYVGDNPTNATDPSGLEPPMTHDDWQKKIDDDTKDGGKCGFTVTNALDGPRYTMVSKKGDIRMYFVVDASTKQGFAFTRKGDPDVFGSDADKPEYVGVRTHFTSLIKNENKNVLYLWTQYKYYEKVEGGGLAAADEKWSLDLRKDTDFSVEKDFMDFPGITVKPGKGQGNNTVVLNRSYVTGIYKVDKSTKTVSLVDTISYKVDISTDGNSASVRLVLNDSYGGGMEKLAGDNLWFTLLPKEELEFYKKAGYTPARFTP